MNIKDCCVKFNKIILAIINVFVVLLGIGVFIFGVWSQTSTEANFDIISTSGFKIPIIFIIFGLLVAIVGIVAFIATIFAHKVVSKIILFIYATILVFVFLFLLGGGIAAAVERNSIEDALQGASNKTLHSATANPENIPENNLYTSWNSVQNEFHCCGVIAYTDWLSADWNTTCTNNGTYSCVPASCCKDASNCTVIAYTNTTLYYDEGCISKLRSTLDQYIGAVIGVAIFLAIVLLVIAIITYIVTFCKTDSNSYSRFDEPK